METKIKLYGVKWDITTAGPSPDNNKRTELFFFGCNRAMEGNPCYNCFNSVIWDNSVATKTYEAKEIVEILKKNASNKYVTISGGEPTDQSEGLIELCKLLKQEGFHILMYTWRLIEDLNKSIVQNIDILIDGEFIAERCLYDEEKGDGFVSSIGSSNQRIWDVKNNEGFAMEELDVFALDESDRIIFFLKDIETKTRTIG